MLKQLHIENIAVIEHTDITFDNGFHVLTGETGAGKSILIDAINAVLGERTSKELIRTGCDSATVSALFAELPESALKKLEELGFEPEDGELLLQRTLTSSGKNTCRIGGRPATAAILREIGGTLINIHGQHDSQALLSPERHVGYLDLVAGNEDILTEYKVAYKECVDIRRRLRESQMDEDEKTRKMELLQYQADELSEAEIEIGETEELEARRTQILNAESIALSLESARLNLTGAEDEAGMSSILDSAARELRDASAFLPELSQYSERLTVMSYEIEDILSDIRDFEGDSGFNQEELDELEERLDLLHDLSRKYGPTEAEMLQFLSDTQAKLDELKFNTELIEQLTEKLQQTYEILKEKGKKLTKSRIAAAKNFEKSVCGELEFLNMPNVRFIVKIEPAKHASGGADNVEFLISANPGEPPKPLSKIASGGELSRIMLAIKNVLAGKDDIATLIFDEIDTGISGRAAQKVGVKLWQTARDRQTICVTHLAQIAALADHQLLIEKEVRSSRTYTNVTSLGEEGRIAELARIIGGAEITETTLSSAREMLHQAENSKINKE